MLWQHLGGTPQTASNHCVYVFPCANNGVVSWACGAGHLLVCQCCLRGASLASGPGNRTLPLLSVPGRRLLGRRGTAVAQCLWWGGCVHGVPSVVVV